MVVVSTVVVLEALVLEVVVITGKRGKCRNGVMTGGRDQGPLNGTAFARLNPVVHALIYSIVLPCIRNFFRLHATRAR